MNCERDQPLADAEAAYLRAARYAEECRHRSTDAVGLAPSLLPRPGAVAITVTTTALAGEWCGVVRRVRPGVRVWSGLWRVSRWVGLVLRLVFFLPVGRPHDDGPHAE